MILNPSRAQRPAVAVEQIWGLLDGLPDCVALIDRSEICHYVNEAFARLIGRTAEALLGKALAPTIGEAQAAVLRPLIARALAGEAVAWQGDLRFADGKDRAVELRLRPGTLNGDGGEAAFLLLRETEERGAAAELEEARRQNRLFHDAIDAIPNGFAVYGADQKVAVCNQAFAALYGETREAMVGTAFDENHRRARLLLKSLDEETFQDPLLGWERSLDKVLAADREPVEVQLHDGRWFLIAAHPLADGGKAFIRTDITRLKQAEATLRESEEHFRRIVEGHPLPVWMVDVETAEILYASPAVAKMLGCDWAEVTNYRATDFYADPKDRADFVARLRETGELVGYETRLQHSDGTVFWVAAACRVFDLDGREVVLTSMADLTERKRTEAELRRARETLEDAIEALSEGFALWDSDERLVTCNQRYLEYNRPTVDILVPGVAWEHYMRTAAERGQYPQAQGRFEEWFKERLVIRAQHSARIEFPQSDGRWFQGSLQKTRQGGTVVIRADITERKAMEEALRESEAMVRRILDACPIPIAMVRADSGELLYESPASQALFGREDHGQGDYGSVLPQYIDPADRLRYIERLREIGGVDDYEIQFKRPDGSAFWASISGRLIDYKGEEVVVSMTKDLTERRAFEAEMARQKEALHQSEKLNAMGALLAGVAHELSNPLAVVVGQALLLAETAKEPAIKARAERIGGAAERCARIVKTFLAMARQSAPQYAMVDLNRVVEGALEITDYVLGSADIEVLRRLAPDLPAIWADADQLSQVIMNLVVNAQQVLADQPLPRRIELVTERDPAGGLRLTVRDNGPGIPEAMSERIFEPFFTTKEAGVGTGIGLSVCQRIVETHGGTISEQGRSGEGAVFVVAFPATAPEPAALPTGESGGDPGRAYRVLVVDDEDDVRETLCELLETLGHDVTTARSGNEALALIDDGRFDLVLSDLRMPDLDGPSFFEALREHGHDLARRTAFVTGDALSPSARRFLERSGRPCLEKPFTPEQVRALIATLVG
ncbi:MAG: PAS domain S-box protein [Kiloniellales bacterium]|nr:PAS domain S-box protein [Kiloniellales bacterium]